MILERETWCAAVQSCKTESNFEKLKVRSSDKNYLNRKLFKSTTVLSTLILVQYDKTKNK